jgi:hypothetical protein
MAGHSRSKNGVLSHAHVPAIPTQLAQTFLSEITGTSPVMTKQFRLAAHFENGLLRNGEPFSP